MNIPASVGYSIQPLQRPLTDIEKLQQQLDTMNQRLMDLERRAGTFVPHQPTYSPQPWEVTC